MLFKKRFWDGLADGSITVAFRRWRRPSVKAGGQLIVPIGLLAIDTVTIVAESDIAEDDAHRAGFASRVELLDELYARAGGDLYRIDFHYAGADPREALRERGTLADSEVEDLQKRLQRLDAASRRGPWTTQILHAIDGQPGVRAADLATPLGYDTATFKLDVRKLKALGLTESLGTGYRLSPRGRTILELLVRQR